MPTTTNERQQAGSDTPELDRGQMEQVERRLFIPALVVHEVVRRQGDEELERPVSALAWSGLAAGLSMGLSMVAEGLLQAHLPDAQWRPLIVRLGYPLGFLLVIIGRQQLFTENTLTPILPLMARRDLRTLWRVARLWATVLAANIAGAHVVGWSLAATSAFRPEVRAAFEQLAREAVNVGFGTAIVKGIFAGWLIAMMVWMLAAVRTGQIAIVLILTYIVGLGEFTHIIAGSVEALYLVWVGQLSWFACVGGYMLPTLIGNVIGGVSLVAAVNHAQVVAGSSEQKSVRD
jgi:formate-nitrite transporter family protein